MKKRIWASFDDYLPPQSAQKLMGKGFANYQFFDALLRYGHFDEYHFFLTNHSHQKAFEKAHEALFKEIEMGSRVKLFCRSQLPEAVSTHDYTVFHQTDHIVHFNATCHFRNQMGSFPVTSFIHSISYPSMMVHLQEMALGGVSSQDAIICSSDAGRQVLRKWFEQIYQTRNLVVPSVQMEVIPFGFDAREFEGINRGMARSQTGLPQHHRIGLCFGRFSEYDKMDLFPLLQAFSMIYRKGAPWQLILAGAAHHPEYVSMVRLWAKALGLEEAVIIKTDLSDTDKAALFKSADFFISPSDNLQETFGLTLVEAMAAGLPLVVSDFSGYREIASPDVALMIPTWWSDLDLFSTMAFGSLSDEASLHRTMAQSVCVDIEALARSMLEFFSHPERCARMGASAQRRFEEKYAYPKIINRLEDFWFRLKHDFSPRAIVRGTQPLFPDYFGAFSHYFTEHIGPDTKVRRTNFAKQLFDANQDYPLFSGMDQVVDRTNIRAIIAYTVEFRTISEIMGQLGVQSGRVHYQIMWMLKHGLLSFLKGNQP